MLNLRKSYTQGYKPRYDGNQTGMLYLSDFSVRFVDNDVQQILRIGSSMGAPLYKPVFTGSDRWTDAIEWLENN
jgi:hypothetical protein